MPGAGCREWELTTEGHEALSGTICFDGGGGDMAVCVRIHETVYLERVNFTVRKLYLDFKKENQAYPRAKIDF